MCACQQHGLECRCELCGLGASLPAHVELVPSLGPFCSLARVACLVLPAPFLGPSSGTLGVRFEPLQSEGLFDGHFSPTAASFR